MMSALIVLAIGLFVLVTGVWLGFKRRRIATWPTTQGRITKRWVEPTKRAVATGPPAFRFEPKVTYVFEANGAVHEGHAISPGSRLGAEKKMRTWVESLPGHVTIHYNPDDPSECYIFPESPLWPAAIAVVGLVMTIGGVLWMLGSSFDGL